jgi:hypothetical protein
MRAAAVRRKLAVATIKMRSLIHSDSSIDNPNLQEPLGNSFKMVPKRSLQTTQRMGGKECMLIFATSLLYSRCYKASDSEYVTSADFYLLQCLSYAHPDTVEPYL